MAVIMHTREKALSMRAQALNILRSHGHPGYMDALTRENCGACALEGYGEFAENGAPLQPNYAGWERIYVQAGMPIPERWREAFEDGRVDANTAYAAGLALDIATFGVTFR